MKPYELIFHSPEELQRAYERMKHNGKYSDVVSFDDDAREVITTKNHIKLIYKKYEKKSFTSRTS